MNETRSTLVFWVREVFWTRHPAPRTEGVVLCSCVRACDMMWCWGKKHIDRITHTAKTYNSSNFYGAAATTTTTTKTKTAVLLMDGGCWGEKHCEQFLWTYKALPPTFLQARSVSAMRSAGTCFMNGLGGTVFALFAADMVVGGTRQSGYATASLR